MQGCVIDLAQMVPSWYVRSVDGGAENAIGCTDANKVCVNRRNTCKGGSFASLHQCDIEGPCLEWAELYVVLEERPSLGFGPPLCMCKLRGQLYAT